MTLRDILILVGGVVFGVAIVGGFMVLRPRPAPPPMPAQPAPSPPQPPPPPVPEVRHEFENYCSQTIRRSLESGPNALMLKLAFPLGGGAIYEPVDGVEIKLSCDFSGAASLTLTTKGWAGADPKVAMPPKRLADIFGAKGRFIVHETPDTLARGAALCFDDSIATKAYSSRVDAGQALIRCGLSREHSGEAWLSLRRQ